MVRVWEGIFPSNYIVQDINQDIYKNIPTNIEYNRVIVPGLENSQGNYCIVASVISYNWRGKCIKGENKSSIECIHNNMKDTAKDIINKALKVKQE